MDWKNVILSAAGSLENGAVFTRKQVVDCLVAQGYAERTAKNAVTPSHVGGLINAMLAGGVIERHGPRGYRIVDNGKLAAKPRKNAGRIMRFEGKPKDGWRNMGLMSDEGAYETELKMCGERFAPGCWNLKLYADGSMARKANWWLQYRNGQLRGTDAATLKANMPDVYQNILDDMKEIEESAA
jgi:hypothetical protein